MDQEVWSPLHSGVSPRTRGMCLDSPPPSDNLATIGFPLYNGLVSTVVLPTQQGSAQKKIRKAHNKVIVLEMRPSS